MNIAVSIKTDCKATLNLTVCVMIYTMHVVYIRLVLKFATRCPLLLYGNVGFLEAIKDRASLLTSSMAAINMPCSRCLSSNSIIYTI